jgi:hypothetical protein
VHENVHPPQIKHCPPKGYQDVFPGDTSARECPAYIAQLKCLTAQAKGGACPGDQFGSSVFGSCRYDLLCEIVSTLGRIEKECGNAGVAPNLNGVFTRDLLTEMQEFAIAHVNPEGKTYGCLTSEQANKLAVDIIDLLKGARP